MALVNYGKEYGRLVVIVDVIDQNRVRVVAVLLLPFTYHSPGSIFWFMYYVAII